jgi:hypothetical protein
MTLVPWIKGQPLVWDVTIVDTLADSYVLKTSEVSGFAAEMACKRKHSKYNYFVKLHTQKWRTNCALRCRRDYRKRQRNVKKILLDLFVDLDVLESGT